MSWYPEDTLIEPKIRRKRPTHLLGIHLLVQCAEPKIVWDGATIPQDTSKAIVQTP